MSAGRPGSRRRLSSMTEGGTFLGTPRLLSEVVVCAPLLRQPHAVISGRPPVAPGTVAPERSGGMQSLESVKEQIEPEFELDLVVAPAQRGVFVVLGGLDDCDFGDVGVLVGQVTAHDRGHI